MIRALSLWVREPKKVFLGEKTYEYNPDFYLVMCVPLPAECETGATAENPMLSLMLDLALPTIKKIIRETASE